MIRFRQKKQLVPKSLPFEPAGIIVRNYCGTVCMMSNLYIYVLKYVDLPM